MSVSLASGILPAQCRLPLSVQGWWMVYSSAPLGNPGLTSMEIHSTAMVRGTVHWFKGIFWPILNSLAPSDAIWQHGSWSTMVQVMACCLMASSHNLDHCWLGNIGFHSSPDAQENHLINLPKFAFGNNFCKQLLPLARVQWVKPKYWDMRGVMMPTLSSLITPDFGVYQ